MSTGPFDDPAATYRALVNDEAEYSLWPAFAATPSGWRVVCEGTRDACLQYVEQNWTDMRPRPASRQF